jgi:hypothetical protein
VLTKVLNICPLSQRFPCFFADGRTFHLIPEYFFEDPADVAGFSFTTANGCRESKAQKLYVITKLSIKDYAGDNFSDAACFMTFYDWSG